MSITEMMRYFMRHVFVDNWMQWRSCAPWDSENARFSNCAFPFVALVPLVIILVIGASHLWPDRLQPNWTSTILHKEIDYGKEKDLSYIWASLLVLLGTCAVSLHIKELRNASTSQVHDVLLSMSWLFLVLLIFSSRPKKCWSSLLLFYFSAIVAELSFSVSRASTWNTWLWLPGSSLICALLSAIVIFCMPFCHGSSKSRPNNTTNTKSCSSQPSPEENLRLWQFLGSTWIWSLLAKGRVRELQVEDVFKLSHDMQSNRLATGFRNLQRSSVLLRLLQANAVDCFILLLLAMSELVLEFASPILLHQFLRAMERSGPNNQAAIVYAVLLFLRGVLSTQFSMLETWFGRQCYERTRAILTSAVFQKAMTRQIAVGSTNQENTKANPNVAGEQEPPNQPAENKVAAKPDKMEVKGNPTDRLAMFKKLLWWPASTKNIRHVSMTTGQVLNIVRSDITEIAQRFRDTSSLIKTPIGLIVAIYLIWVLLGSSCLLGVFVIGISQVLNATVTRLQIRWRRKGMQAKDARIQITSEYIEAIRHLRWYAWQEIWLKKVFVVRQQELNVRFVGSCLSLLTYTITTSAGALFPVASFIAYTAVAKQELRIDLIFPALQLFSSLQGRLKQLPTLITSLLNAFVAMERIEEHDLAPGVKTRDTIDEGCKAKDFNFQDCSFAWPGQPLPVLKNVSLELAPGLTLVYGEIGSGKTAFLLALLNEMDLLQGRREVPSGVIGYCSQTPWLQSTTIRENILFSCPYNEERYQKVLDSCELLPDVASFKNGDLSLLGENGIGLSGGQRARLALARAVYSQAKILLLDDPLSALDQSTAENVVRKWFVETKELMQDRIVVIATHQTDLLHHLASQFIHVSDGRLSVSSSSPFSQPSNFQRDEPLPKMMQGQSLTKSMDDHELVAKQFMTEEKRGQGGIKFGIFRTFVKAGRFWWVVLFGTLILTRLFGVTEQWFYKAWGEAYNVSSLSQDFNPSRQKDGRKPLWSLNLNDYIPPPAEDLSSWLLLLVLVSTGRAFSLGIYALSQVTAIYATTQSLFEQALIRISSATFRYYDVTPTGRIINRITSDIEKLQSALDYFGNTIFSASFFFVSVGVIAIFSPVFFFFATSLMVLFALLFRYFLPTSRSLKRMESSSLSPLYSIFGELLGDHGAGVVTIRAFLAESAFESRLFSIVDQSQAYGHFFWAARTWLTYRYDMISAFSTLLLTVTALVTDLSPGLTAFLLLNANNLVQSTHMLCIRFGGLQAEFVSVERIAELLDTEQEAVGSIHPPASWPRKGSAINFKDVTVRYGSQLEPVLHNLCISIPGGKTTAIVGRTGSGKSTLAATLLNIVHPDPGGNITIDGISLAEMNVQDLRRRVTYVPQDPILFLGTVRENIDPVNEFTDQECNRILQLICTTVASSEPWALNTFVESGGRNFSQGQRQVFGIMRAMLRRSAVLILDEVMASIDVATARLLQRVLREELTGATIVMIAHRMDDEMLGSVDYEVVLENGQVVKQSFLARSGDGSTI